ncbi:HNH endonuclease signature motif containing protein [Herpetosiphon gulosus]|uniref:HNH nuclease domain-containing protein n=1 Tax=Herpetosiphon gulosus TaxID=1973496 RepID=A0ABP9X7C8_9CHLR
MSSTISQKDIKLLWGRAANRCAFPDCRIELSQDAIAASASFTLGEQAHIVGEKESAARGNSVLTLTERNSYFNLILLCPTHHTLIDNNESDYPVDRLHIIKDAHELWVQESLARTTDARRLSQESIYASLIDTAQLVCPLETWRGWIYPALMTPPRWHKDTPAKAQYFREKVFGAIWPGTIPELERALKTLSITMSEMMYVFQQHAERERGDLLCGIKFYKSPDYFPPFYGSDESYEQRLFFLEDKFDAWIKSYHFFFIEMVKSVNWLADVVRREINPAFFAIEGKFLLPYDNETVLYEYTEEEKTLLPEKLEEEIEANTYQFQS